MCTKVIRRETKPNLTLIFKMLRRRLWGYFSGEGLASADRRDSDILPRHHFLESAEGSEYEGRTWKFDNFKEVFVVAIEGDE